MLIIFVERPLGSAAAAAAVEPPAAATAPRLLTAEGNLCYCCNLLKMYWYYSTNKLTCDFERNVYMYSVSPYSEKNCQNCRKLTKA